MTLWHNQLSYINHEELLITYSQGPFGFINLRAFYESIIKVRKYQKLVQVKFFEGVFKLFYLQKSIQLI